VARVTSILARVRAGIYPFEIVTTVSLFATVVFLRRHRLRIDWQTFSTPSHL